MFLLAGIGGMFGACARFGLGALVNSKIKTISPYPIGTFIINATGSFFLGLLAKWHLEGNIGDNLWLLLGIGFCGAYTTFSTFGTETITLIDAKRFKLASIYVIASVLFGIIFAWAGLIVG